MLFCASAYAADNADDISFLDMVERKAFDYFWLEANPKTGLIKNTTEESSPASTAAVGFGLSALPIGIERGWITKEDGYKRALTTLKFFRDKVEDKKGFFYHYLDIDTGERAWDSEISTIDSALLFAGMLTVGEYFKGTEVESIAIGLYEKADWRWLSVKDKMLYWGWRPETGFEPPMYGFSESILAYLLALGSPTYPLLPESWNMIYRPVGNYKGEDIIYAADGALFAYQFPLAWFDLRNIHDNYADYFQNAKNAALANRQFCIDNKGACSTYEDNIWGLSPSLGPVSNGYGIYGGKPGAGNHDGTVAPYVVAGSIPMIPDMAISSYRFIYEKYKGKMWGKYGLKDAFNVAEDWSADHYISIDQGLTLLAIENYRTGLIWKYFMRNPYARIALDKAGFKAGAQLYINPAMARPGNPGAEMEIRRLDRKINIDGDMSDWHGMPYVDLTSADYRNVEINIGIAADEADLSGRFYLAWDDKYLYIAGDVKDDIVVARYKGELIYQDDLIEVFFDTDSNGFFFDKNRYDYQWGFAPRKYKRNKAMAWAWGPVGAYPKTTKYAYEITPTGYAIEAAIPLSAMNTLSITNGKAIRFSVSIHDRDGEKDESKLTWSVDHDSIPGTILFGKVIFGMDKGDGE